MRSWKAYLKQNKQNMNIQGVKRFELLIKLFTALTIVMFSEYVKAEFPKRRNVTVKGIQTPRVAE